MNNLSLTDRVKQKINNLSADLVILNANVLTMNAKEPHSEAVAVKAGKIIGIGSTEEIKQYCGTNTEKIDLNGKTLLPGFIESHNHLIVYASTISGVDIGFDNNKSIEDILQKIKQKVETSPPGTWIEGWGYDDTAMIDNRHPNRFDLDKVAPEHPVCIKHVSGHICAVNTLALNMAGITKDTKDPEGGEIIRDSNGEPTGVLSELPAQRPVLSLIPSKTVDELVEGLKKCNEIYLKAGVTSSHDAGIGLFGPNDLLAYEKAITNDDLLVRINGMLYHGLIESILEDENDLSKLGICTKCGDERLKIGPVKIVQGGSIQGLTAALFDPYLCDPSKRGELYYSQEKLEEMVLKYHKAGFQIALHANGDREIESVLSAYESALNVLPRNNHRHRIEHCQMAHDDQLDRMAKSGICASFFPAHIYYWGDRHRDIFIGPKRAARLNPLRTAIDKGVTFGFHSDTPVTPVGPLKLLYAAVARETSSGKILGQEQAIRVREALNALTIDAAFLAFEENIKGSIEIGKLADFVVLSEDPYKLSPTNLKDLQVMMTIIDGNIVYQKK